MSESVSLLVFLGDQRLSSYATGSIPVWLWSADATRILWGNPTAAAIFNANSSTALTGHTIDPKGSAALQIARLAGTLPHGAAPRLERLRGFGGRMGGALLCGCSRIVLADRTPAILVVATEAAGPKLPLAEQAQRLLAGSSEPVALYGPDGSLLHATPAAQAMLGQAKTLTALDAKPLGATALAAGRAEGHSIAGRISLDRVGAGSATALLATFAPQAAASAAPAQARTPRSEQPVKPLEPPVKVEATAERPPLEAARHPEPAKPVEAPAPAKSAEISPLANPIETSAPAKPAETPAPAAPRRPARPERRRPLRFVWQMDADSRFVVDSPDFLTLIGPHTAASLGQPWADIAAKLGLDPEGHVARAFASRDTWSGIIVGFPMDGSDKRLAVELSGLPVFDRDRTFRGYRGFGICRDAPRTEPPVFRSEQPVLTVVPPSENVVPFRSSAPAENAPTLTPVEHKAFSELASRLTARLRNGANAEKTDKPDEPAPVAPPRAEPPVAKAPVVKDRGEARPPATDQRPILDRLPVGVLVYRLDKLIYANRAFLDWTGYPELRALEDAGGLDALFVEPSSEDQAANNGAQALSIATNKGDQVPVAARLFTSPWEGESALVLMLTGVGGTEQRESPHELKEHETSGEAAELRAVLDTATDGIMLLDREHRVVSANHGAEELYNVANNLLAGTPFASLFTPETQAAALEALKDPNPPGTARLDTGRDVVGRKRDGGLVPLLLTVSRLDEDSGRLCAIVRDLSYWKKTEGDLLKAKRRAEKASSAKSDFIAKVSHEIRTPLNAIIGFSEVMMQERFGPIGNERYKQYLKDIHASGDHLVSLLNDLLDLSKIEAGKLELRFANIDLNDLTQQCVTLMQPQANRERIIIRTSLPQELPTVTADARSVRQIVLNLLSNSIKFTGVGGQVIVSTAVSDLGDVVLRVRDTGAGMSEQDLAVAMEPFRQLATSSRWGSAGTGLGLPLTKALAEANRASFKIRSAVNAGTLVEVAFPGTRIAAE